ncbi:uncharacterized protein [Phaseolus vulgaris]|uniref:uncharacterized protein n=1 Tax=Phaseolus vulgaris TaxID=3885 RepID=UPI0035CA8BFC
MAMVSVLVNGSPTEEFRPTRGLRQGDPLAPFLFLIVAEGLAGLLRKAVKEDLLSGIKVGRAELECCMLQFADDTLFMCEDSFSNVFTMKVILRVFKLASGLKVNFYKSKLAGLQVVTQGACSFENQSWKKLKLDLVLGMGNAYRLQRSFLWAWGKDNKHISWVRWENVCKSQEEGGLGVKDVRKFNRALLAKWKWRLMSEEKGKRKEISLSKYYSDDGSNQGYGSQHSWWWSDLGKACDEGEGEGWFHNHVAWKVGNGDKIRLYSISLDQGKLVGELGSWGALGWSWRLRWRRIRFKWEKSMEVDLMNLITGKIVNKDYEDSLVWSEDNKGVFSVKFAYLTLCNSSNGASYNVFSMLWQAKAVSTYDNLIKRGLALYVKYGAVYKAAEVGDVVEKWQLHVMYTGMREAKELTVRRFKEAEWKEEMTKVLVLEYLEGSNVVLLGIQRSK